MNELLDKIALGLLRGFVLVALAAFLILTALPVVKYGALGLIPSAFFGLLFWSVWRVVDKGL